jgi:hypothetical protein
VLAREPPSGLAGPTGEAVVAQVGSDPPGEISRIGRFHERARETILHGLGRAAAPRRDHRQTGPARLERRVAEPLAAESPSVAIGSVHEDGQTTEDLAHILDEAGQLEPIAKARAVGEPAQFVGIGRVFRGSQAGEQDAKLGELL